MFKKAKDFIKKNIISSILIPPAFAVGITATEPTVVDFDTKNQDVQIQVKFKKTTSKGKDYQDALYYSLNQWNNQTTEEIEAQKQARVDNWENIVKQQANHTPTKAELQNQIDILNDQLQQVQKLYNEIP